MVPPNSDGDVSVGQVLKPRGLQGEAFLLPLTDHPERFDSLDVACLLMKDGEKVDLKISWVRKYGKRMGIKFSGVDTPQAASKYHGSYVQVSRDSVFDLPEDSYYVFEMIGLMVESEAGEKIGKVQEVLSYPGNDVYVVDRDGKELLLPAVQELMRVDMEGRRIVVRDLDGLL